MDSVRKDGPRQRELVINLFFKTRFTTDTSGLHGVLRNQQKGHLTCLIAC